MDEQHQAKQVESQVREAWSEVDAQAKVDVRMRPDGKFDLQLVSEKFAELDSAEREALFWSRIRRLPSTLTIRMTYALLLAPDEADDFFSAGGE